MRGHGLHPPAALHLCWRTGEKAHNMVQMMQRGSQRRCEQDWDRRHVNRLVGVLATNGGWSGERAREWPA